jgi:hypothetical protein
MSETSEMSDTTTMNDGALRRDGNAAAGLLSEIFAIEMTSALTTCAHCGRVGALGSLLLYGGEMGAVLRCPTCDAVQMRVARIRRQYWMDTRGITVIQITPTLQS